MINNQMGYESGKIYKLQCSDGYYYIGSTTNSLSRRLITHKASSKRDSCKNYKIYKHINQLGWNNVEILLIQEYPCSTKADLCIKETEYIACEIDNSLCLNNRLSFVSDEERLERRRECESKYRKQRYEKAREYYNKNKVEIIAKRKANDVINNDKRVALLNNDECQRSLAGN
jgi:predicted GIY-YIG superfamily endonuclease